MVIALSIDGWPLNGLLANTSYDTLSAILTAIDLLTFDPTDLADITNALPDVNDLLRQDPTLPNALVEKEVTFKLKPRGKLGKLYRLLSQYSSTEEYIGEFGAAIVAKLLGFVPSEMEMAYHGIDAIFYHEELGKYLVVEAKGGSSDLRPPQMTHRWIERSLRKAIRENRRYGGDQRAEAELVEDELDAENQFIAGVVSLDLRPGKNKLKFGFQFFEPGDPLPFKDWIGF